MTRDQMIETMARAIWRQRDSRLPTRVQRLKPDAMDMQTGAFALVIEEATAALNAIEEKWVIVPREVIEDARAILEWDGGHRSKGYNSVKGYDARERLHAYFFYLPAR